MTGCWKDRASCSSTILKPVASLYEQYVSFCKSSGKHPCSGAQFGKALTNQGYEQVRDSTGRYWRGVSISIVC
ncbi:MAG: primase-like DNA-binding domain-containing protein [Candidatus Puniceispirillaceae bacterium]